MAIAMLCVSAIAWTTPGTKNNTTTGDSSEATVKKPVYYFPWDYVMDWRYGRTCDPGGGICFKNGYGDVFQYWILDASMGDVIPGMVVDPKDVPGDDGTDPEVGPMYLRIEDSRLHVIFCRSVEGSTFDVDEPVRFRDEILEALHYKFTLKPGKYRVDFSKYKDYGEAWIDVRFDQ